MQARQQVDSLPCSVEDSLGATSWGVSDTPERERGNCDLRLRKCRHGRAVMETDNTCTHSHSSLCTFYAMRVLKSATSYSCYHMLHASLQFMTELDRDNFVYALCKMVTQP